jgi:hypothetical protein
MQQLKLAICDDADRILVEAGTMRSVPRSLCMIFRSFDGVTQVYAPTLEMRQQIPGSYNFD